MFVHTLITILTSTLLGAAPDLCADAYLNAAGEPIADSTGRTLSRFCEWAGPEAPVLESNVCCSIDDDAAECELANVRGYCAKGSRMWCSHGEVDCSGRVTCMQAFPSVCGAGLCVEAPLNLHDELSEELLCCTVGGCVPHDVGDFSCEGSYLVCEWGMSMADGTVECFN